MSYDNIIRLDRLAAQTIIKMVCLIFSYNHCISTLMEAKNNKLGA